MNIVQLNEQVIIAEFHPEINTETLNKVQHLKQVVENDPFEGLQEIWSSYHSVAFSFDTNKTSFKYIRQHLLAIPPPSLSTEEENLKNRIDIPVQYHKDTPDILALSRSLELTVEEIARIHIEPVYQVAMLGFQPGFPFLIGLPEKLHFPRKSSPSLHVPKGSVAIGGAQTGIYPSESPGGWYVIGHTPSEMFTKPDSFLLKPGDRVKFHLA